MERECWVAGDLRIDVGRQQVEQAGTVVELPPLSFNLLLELVRAAPDVLSLDQLMDRVWSGLVVSPETVTQRVKLLRDALGDSAQEPRYVVGMRGRGYRLVPAVVRVVQQGAAPLLIEPVPDAPTVVEPVPVPVAEASPEPPLQALPAEPPLAASPPDRKRVGPLGLWLLGATVLAVLAALLWWRGGLRAAPPAASVAEPAILVLPFERIGGAADEAYVAAGIREELVNRLAELSGLRIKLLPDNPDPNGAAPDYTEIAQRLGATHLLRGAVGREGERVRVSVQLFDARTAASVGARRYEKPFGQLFTLQDAVAVDVANWLRVRLLDRGQESVEPDLPPHVHDLMLQAHYLTVRTEPEGHARALELYRQVLAILPDHAPAWEGISRVYQVQTLAGYRPPAEGFALEREAAIRALAIDPDYALSHARLGSIAMYGEGDFATAARHIQRAVDLAPRNQLTVGNMAILARAIGRLDVAIRLGDIADTKDPLIVRGTFQSGYNYLAAGRLEESLVYFRKLLLLSPEFIAGNHYLALVLLQLGRNDEALEAAEREKSPFLRQSALAIVQHTRGHHAESDAALARMQAMHAQGKGTAYAIARVHAWRGEADAAFAWLDRAVAPGAFDGNFYNLVVEPLFAPVRDDPRWAAFLARVGRAPAQLAAIRLDTTLIESSNTMPSAGESR